MRIVHTSDWHLGKTLHREPLYDAQRAFIDELISIVKDQKADAVLVSGDVFDRSVPSAEALEIYEDALRRLTELCPVVITSGNHDSPQRLGLNGWAMERAGIHLRTTLADIARPVLLGDSGKQVAVYGIPYLEPALTDAHLDRLAPVAVGNAAGGKAAGDSTDGDAQSRRLTHERVLRKALHLAAADLANRGGMPSVVMAHAWFAGGTTGVDEMRSESERPSLGTIEIAPLNLLAPFSYAALGHLHKPQDPHDTMRYSGSPIKYSFGEIKKDKRVLVVDISDAGLTSVSEIGLSEHRGMSEVQGTLTELLTSREFDVVQEHYLRVQLTDPEPQAHALDRLRARFPHILNLRQPENLAGRADLGAIAELQPVDVCCEFVEFARGTEADEWEREQLTLAVAAAFAANAEVVVGAVGGGAEDVGFDGIGGTEVDFLDDEDADDSGGDAQGDSDDSEDGDA